MTFRSIVTLIFAPMIVISNALITSAQNRDEAQIRALQERQAAAWNQHDATAIMLAESLTCLEGLELNFLMEVSR